MYIVYDRIYVDFPANILYVHRIYIWFWPTLNHFLSFDSPTLALSGRPVESPRRH